jgi:AraC-like DNA-binding protein
MDNKTEKNNLTELKKLSNLRICIESLAAKETAARARTDDSVAPALLNILEKTFVIAQKEDYAAFGVTDHNLHEKIIELSEVPKLPEIWNSVWQGLASFHRVSLVSYWPDLRVLLQDHKYLVESICSGDINAAEDAIKNHLEAVWYRIADHNGNFVEVKDPLERTTAYLTLHLNRTIRLETVAREIAYVSPGYLSKLFKDRYNLSFQSYLQTIRMGKAAELIAGTELPISRLAIRVGYNDVSRFCEHFKKHFRITPVQFRQKRYTPALNNAGELSSLCDMSKVELFHARV